MPHTVTIQVRYQETDQMGVVHHGNYFVWFEVGRTSLIKNAGTSYGALEKKGVLLPVIKASCEYKLPARYEDVVTIETVIAELSPVKINFRYKALCDGQLLARGETLHVWVNREMRPFNLKRKYPDVYALLEAHVTPP